MGVPITISFPGFVNTLSIIVIAEDIKIVAKISKQIKSLHPTQSLKLYSLFSVFPPQQRFQLPCENSLAAQKLPTQGVGSYHIF